MGWVTFGVLGSPLLAWSFCPISMLGGWQWVFLVSCTWAEASILQVVEPGEERGPQPLATLTWNLASITQSWGENTGSSSFWGDTIAVDLKLRGRGSQPHFIGYTCLDWNFYHNEFSRGLWGRLWGESCGSSDTECCSSYLDLIDFLE